MIKISAENLKKRRKELNLTQEKAADSALTSKQVISNLERGFTKNVSYQMLKALSCTLKCTEDYLTGSSSDPALDKDGLKQILWRIPKAPPLEEQVQNINTNLTEALEKLDDETCKSSLDILKTLVNYLKKSPKVSIEKNNAINKILKILINY